MRYLLGIDLGTSATKTVLFDEAGSAVCSSTVEYPLYQPQNGWAEQDPTDWWNAAQSTIRDVLAKSGIDAGLVAGIGISGQMHGLVLLDGNGQVLRRSIIWCDGRTAAECAEITEKVGHKRLIELSANPALTGFTAGKILWVRKNEPEIYGKVRHILLPKDYVRFRLTGEYAGEVSDMAGTNLLDVPNRRWSGEILEKLEIDPDLLPVLRESYEVAGEVHSTAASLTGLKAGTPVVGGAGDNMAAAGGTGVVSKGSAFVTIGTSGVIFAHSDNVTIDPEGRVHTFCSAVPGAWTVMSCSLAAGGSLQWFRNTFCRSEMEAAAGLGTDPYAILDRQAERIPPGSDRLLFLPYLMGERSPILDPDSRGVFFGLSASHTRQHLLRAVMEGVTFSQRHCLDVLKGMGVLPGRLFATGGGGNSPFWRQMLADILECPVDTIDNAQGPALGAAILAGVGTGVYENVQSACGRMIRIKGSQEPIEENSRKYREYYELYKELYPALRSGFRTLASL